MRTLVSMLSSGRSRPVLPDWQRCLPVVVERIRAAGPTLFFDAAFPRHMLHHAVEDAVLLRLPEAGFKGEFHRRFQAGGGARPISLYAPEAMQAAEANTAIWLFVDDPGQLASMLPGLAAHGVRLLTLLDEPALAQTRGIWTGWSAIRFTLPDGSPTGFVGWAEARAAKLDALFVFARQPEPPRGWLGTLAKGAPESAATVQVGLAHEGGLAARFDAGRLVVDNGYPAERQAEASWLWLGPSQTARFALGRIPERARQVTVDFMPSELHRDLGSQLRFQLDGVGVPHHAVFHGDGSGRASVALADRAATVLSVACRSSQRAGLDAREIRACVAAIGFTA
jgi:hypothetical protein